MIGTSEILTIAILIILIIVAIFWAITVYKRRKSLENFSYQQGANLDTGLVGNGITGAGTVNFQCALNEEICLWRATAICSGIGPTGNEEASVTPFSNGVNSPTPYGDFNVNSTIDLTSAISSVVNGESITSYDFDNSKLTWPAGLGQCISTYDQTSGQGIRPQLIATYACIPRGSTCKNYYTPSN